MEVLNIIWGGLREGTPKNWTPKFRWGGYQFNFEYWVRKHKEMFELKNDERNVYCIIVDPGRHDMKAIKEHLKKLQ
jgi:hypothetical protein